ncbi:MAG: hypothetical protein E7Z80_02990 [Methanobrevibacter thaueri]|nr:hypothetical protein [Methanobrevibacter thaueri]
MKNKNMHHLNDKTHKYLSYAQSKRQHQYLNLPGEFKQRYPQEIVFRNMDGGRMDEVYQTDEGWVIDLEEESGEISPDTLKKFAKYVIFLSYQHYPKEVYLGVICHKKPKSDYECYEYAPSCYIKIHYHYFPQEELCKKYENVINKVKQKQILTDTEAMDLAFICKFISSKKAPKVIETITYIFKDAKIPDKKLKIDIGAIICAMISKRITSHKKIKELLDVINVKEIDDEMTKIVYEEFGDILKQKDDEIKSKDDEINSYKSKIEQLKKIGDLKSNDAQKIIQSMILM